MDNLGEENLFQKTFFWMFLGLLATALTAWYAYSTNMLDQLLADGFFPVILLGEVIVVLLFTFLFKRLPATMAAILYFVYAFANGITLSTVFYMYNLSSIVVVFFASAGLFGGMALIGYITKKDLSNWRTILFGTLIIGIIVSIVNIFIGNQILNIGINWVILLTFCGITIYDMNKIKMLAQDDRLDKSKLHIYGAMQLYLDFINIFLRIISLFGKRK